MTGYIPLTTSISAVAAPTTAAFHSATTTVAVATAVATTSSSLQQTTPPPSKQRKQNPYENAPKKNSIQQLLDKYFQLPQMIRFAISGALGNIVFFAIDKIMYNEVLPLLAPSSVKYVDDIIDEGVVMTDDIDDDTVVKIISYLLHDHRETTSFFVSYLIQIVAQHFLNAALVFGLETINTKEKYFKTLLGVYSAYSTTLVVSTLLNAVLLQIGIQKDIAFWGTLLASGILNYYLLSWISTRKQNEQKRVDSAAVPEQRRRGVRTNTVALVTRGGGKGGRVFLPPPKMGRVEKSRISVLKELVTSILFGESFTNQKEEEVLRFVRSCGEESIHLH